MSRAPSVSPSIDLATPDDIPVLVELLRVLFSIEQDFEFQPEKQAAGLRRLLADTERACIVVARDDSGTAIGMASGQLVISTAEGAPSLWIEDVVVVAAARGRGVGAALLERLLAWATEKGAVRAQLLADMNNQPALDFYRHLGWQKTALTAYRIGIGR